MKKYFIDSEGNTRYWWIIALMIFVVGVLWATNLKILIDEDLRGVYGDMFGAVNSLFSGLAFGGIIITIIMQKEELRHQREELQLTRKEFQQQNITLKSQKFDNNFFQMLDLHHKIVSDIDFETRTKRYAGRDVFRHRYYNELKPEMEKAKSREDLIKRYNKIYELFQTDLGHYFRHLYRIIKLIDEQKFNIESDPVDFNIKFGYTSLLRAQISDFELQWLFYNGLSGYGVKFKPLIEKYGLLKNLLVGSLPNAEHHKLYDLSAYQNTTREYSLEDMAEQIKQSQTQ